jgi:hypothetical protein
MRGVTGTAKLKYASRYMNMSWEIKWVTNSTDVGLFTSIAVDKNGDPHISYVDNKNANVKYAVINSTTGKWMIEHVEKTSKNLA